MARKSPALQVFLVALRLGLTSFGGPVAHLGYFNRTYVDQLRWLTPAELSELIALCQMLPGPTSSQVGFLIGQRRAGLTGACAAWAGFTLPSALLMLGYALYSPRLPPAALEPVLRGLKWVAVMVVAQAVWQMARALCTDWPRTGIAVLAGAALLWLHSAAIPALTLLAAAAAGACLLRRRVLLPSAPLASDEPGGARRGLAAFTLFAVLEVLLIVQPTAGRHDLANLAAVLYRAGSLVFGGGHVVLPLLRDALVPGGWLSDDQFLSGYGAAQALPGPLFAFAAYIGALTAPPQASVPWAAIALLGLFLPGMLLALAAGWLRVWLRRFAVARAALAGLSAAMVGVLAAALIRPVGTSAIHDLAGLCVVVLGVLALQRWRLAPIVVVVLTVMLSIAAAAWG